jgi:hypothetical protein
MMKESSIAATLAQYLCSAQKLCRPSPRHQSIERRQLCPPAVRSERLAEIRRDMPAARAIVADG